ncbi:hypothetical protein CHGG_07029 [Chaetomium globosum CBS 148.51]|uniref:Major facilitator superfamily (MFS) profile domain-containing protein n=1 Tax=Chaetomium globosum (strain ATCC 6205 / CBS 148.51 / DSM 1962 / NBRC 6347 / NRRL 1970) TaxID=306901 RepID=Q2GYC5_CHAGB|nr:uncharacterized protein CHGG_07029 [Chaetomium globosum CBS 148.51]EAQ85776.1 hypothetical protein CHGG_07029 [Chaetomium globosum CBS 148.51]
MTTPFNTRRHGDNDSSATSPTVAENTPLLRSESSFVTARDGSPASDRQPGPGPEQPPLGWKRTTCIVFSMWALIFLQASNMSGISTTQSTIAADLDAYESAMWFTSAYMISMSSVAPLAGRLAMIFSPATMVLLASGCFSVGALVTAVAPTFAVFILGRVVLGVGSGGIMTLCMILLTAAQGFTLGVSAGAVVFGALLPVLGWRLLFGAQAPMAALAGLGVSLSIPPFTADENTKDKTTLQKLAGLDYAGAVSLTVTIVLFLYGLSGTIQPLPIGLSLITLAIFLAVESRAKNPVLPLTVLKSRGVLLSCFSQLGFMAARWTVLFYAPIFVLAVRGLSPALAGSILIPTNAGFGIGGLLVGALHIRHAGSFWFPGLLTLALFSMTLFVLAFVGNAATPIWLFGTTIGGGVFTRTLRDALVAGFEKLDGGEGLDKAREKLITVLIGSPAVVWKHGVLSAAERVVAVVGYERALEVLYKSAAVMCVLVLVMQAGTGWKAAETKGNGGSEEEVDERERDRATEA